VKLNNNPKLDSLKKNEFFRHNAIFWLGSLLVSFLNYLYYPITGRLLNPVNFGETQTIISFMTQTGIFLQVLGLVSIGIIKKYPDLNKREIIRHELSRLTLAISVVIFFLTVLLAPVLKSFFNFSSSLPFIVLAISLLVSVPLSFANAYLQGHKRFAILSVSNIVNSASKIILAVIFILLGFKTLGALGGLIVAQLLSLTYALYKGSGVRNFLSNNFKFKRLEIGLLKPELPFAAMVFCTSLTTNLLLSFDILVVKHYFPPHRAGLYTGISIISNIIYFACAPFANVLVPSLIPNSKSQQNLNLLKRTLKFTVLIGGSVTIVFLVLPHLVVTILLGHRYSIYSKYLRGLSISIFALSIANILIYYHIGVRHFLVAPTVLIGLVTTLVMLDFWHSNIQYVVTDLVIGGLVLLALLSGLTFVYRLRET
jgi:O-antigen/teichoic acid export membrane protein